MKIQDIKKDLQRKLEATVTEIAVDSFQIMHEELDSFYAGGIPSQYVRTGVLGESPEITDMYCLENVAGLTAGLDTGIKYNTGTFSGEQVIAAAESGALAGKGGFWRRSENRIEEAVDRAVRKNFI